MSLSIQRATTPAAELTTAQVIAARKRWKRRVLTARRVAAAVPIHWIGGRLYYILGNDHTRWIQVPGVPELPKPKRDAGGVEAVYVGETRIRSTGTSSRRSQPDDESEWERLRRLDRGG